MPARRPVKAHAVSAEMAPASPPAAVIKPRLRLAGAMLLALAGLAVFVGWGEATGWPFLAASLERALSSTLDRRVALTGGAASPADAPGRFGIRFLGGLHLVAAQIEIGAPAWSSAPYLLRADDVVMDLRYIDLWRAHRGQPLRIQRLQARTLVGDLERLADGRSSWQLGPVSAAAASAPSSFPRFEQLRADSGTLRYRDAVLGAELQARFSLTDRGLAAATTADAAFQLRAEGHYRHRPMKVELASAGLLPWGVSDASPEAMPFTLDATVGSASFAFKGSVVDASNLSGLSGHFRILGPSLAAVGDPLGVTLPTTAPFRTDGDVSTHGGLWRVVVTDATVGQSRLNGAFVYDAGRSRPLLSGRLGGPRLMLVDLGPVLGTTPALPAAAAAASAPAAAVAAPIKPTRQPGKVLPTRPFDLASLRTMDADVQVDIREVDLNTGLLEPLRPLHARLQLASGVLTLGALEARTSDGRLTGELRLDGRGPLALWNADLRWDGVRLEQWIHLSTAPGQPPIVSGRLNGRAVLEGQGVSTAAILARLKGTVRTELLGGAVSHLLVEKAGIDLAESLGLMVRGDDALPVSCAVADLVALDGVLRPRVMVLDTADSTVWVDGSLSLATETLDLRAVVSPKDFSPLTLRSPLRVRGSFLQPEVSLDKAPMARKLAASLLLALVNPLAALIPLIDVGDAAKATEGASGCKGLAQLAAALPAKPAQKP
jgi:uncharacterized protein involved in outer membrane biogenesis